MIAVSRLARSAATAVGALLVACVDAPSGVAPPPPPPRPVIGAASVAANPNNALSAVVTARVSLADSVAVAFFTGDAVTDSVTPAVATIGDSAVIPVLGLLPRTRYAMWVVAYGGGKVVGREAMSFITDTLPSDLPSFVASGTDPTPGFVVFSAGRYGLVIDNTGRVVWYRRFPNTPGLNFQAQPTGRYTVRPPTPDPADLEPWVEVDPLGNVTRTFGCAGGLQPRFHDLIAEPGGSYWVMCDETRTMDLSSIGGVANAQVMGTVVQHMSATGVLLFQWNPFEHFAITDLDSLDRSGPLVNWTHGNALNLDGDGNLIVSFRSLSELTKIDTRTGAVLWRMGGLRNQFAFEGTSMPAFLRQHGLRLTGRSGAGGTFALLDNAGDSTATRAERYRYDEGSLTASQIASYGSLPAVRTQLGGTTQDLPGGRTLVAFGSGRRVEEYDSLGQVVWRIEGDPGYVFRAQRIRSLYRPGVGLAR